jgi:DNA-binding CsgD family transcriptional regulator
MTFSFWSRADHRPDTEKEMTVPELPGLAGQDRELAVLASMLDRATRGHGSALLLRGNAATGKTAQLIQAQQLGADRGMRVLASNGARTETELPFSGLHQLLWPVRTRAAALTPPYGQLLAAALTLDPGLTADTHRVALSLLELLAAVAAEQPLLVTVDDAHWLDCPSRAALAFASRRVGTEPIAVLLSLPDGDGEPFEAAGLASISLSPAPGLTPQELQIARLAARGLSNREIGDLLFLSHRTVGSHLYHLFPKLGVTTRGQLGGALSR